MSQVTDPNLCDVLVGQHIVRFQVSVHKPMTVHVLHARHDPGQVHPHLVAACNNTQRHIVHEPSQEVHALHAKVGDQVRVGRDGLEGHLFTKQCPRVLEDFVDNLGTVRSTFPHLDSGYRGAVKYASGHMGIGCRCGYQYGYRYKDGFRNGCGHCHHWLLFLCRHGFTA